MTENYTITFYPDRTVVQFVHFWHLPIELPAKSEVSAMKSSRNLDSSDETEVNAQSANVVIGLLSQAPYQVDKGWISKNEDL